jgi:hypothetical protein
MVLLFGLNTQLDLVMFQPVLIAMTFYVGRPVLTLSLFATAWGRPSMHRDSLSLQLLGTKYKMS